jgi:branched-chain amino acid transport system permease protein
MVSTEPDSPATTAPPAPGTELPSRLIQLARPVVMVAVLALVLVLPYIGINSYWMQQLILISILSLIVSGLNTTLGYGGELAVGQVALYAVGAYMAGWLANRHGIHDVLLCMGAAIVAVMILGFVSGIPGLRLGGWSLAMVTFFLVLLIPNVINLLHKPTGGSEGLSIPTPTMFGMHLRGPTLGGKSLYLFVMVVTFIWFALLRNLIKSPHGNAFLVLKQSPILASTLGISVFRLKLFAYVVGAIPCGIAGVMYAFLLAYISPSSFTFSYALLILTASIVGGSQSIYGAFFGAALLQLAPEHIGPFRKYALIIYGVFLLAAGLVFSDGIAGLVRSLGRQVRRLGWLPESAIAVAPTTGPDDGRSEALEALAGDTLTVDHAEKVFGGLRALDDVSLQAHPGQITALIGPNGSGKTTLLNLVCGFYKPTSGAVRLGDIVVSGRAPYRTARLGVARTFQTPLIPKNMTTRAFVATGRYVTHRISIPTAILRLPGFRRGMKADDDEAMRLLRMLGVAHVANQEVTSLPLGTRRLVEVARALASEPKVFLFDEVGSGLDQEDLDRLERAMDLIRGAGGTVVLVEHNFPLVLKVADRIHVLSNGRLIASGTPAEIQSDARVLEEYTGPSTRAETIADLEQGTDGSGTMAEETR